MNQFLKSYFTSSYSYLYDLHLRENQNETKVLNQVKYRVENAEVTALQFQNLKENKWLSDDVSFI